MPVLLSFLTIESPNTPFDELTNAPVGTGPYTVTPRSATDDIVLVRRDGYWNGQPEVEQATYVRREESTLRAAMVAVGEADIALRLAVQDADNPATDVVYRNGETTRVRFTFKGPLEDIRVRKAFNLAVDREAIRDGLLNDSYVIATQMFEPLINGYNPDLVPWPYDPEEAKRLLADAQADGVDLTAPIPLQSYIGAYAENKEVMEVLISMWQSVGLSVQLQPMERAQYLQLVNKPFAEDRPALLISELHDNSSGDAAFTMYFRYHTNGQQSEFSDPKLDDLIDTAAAASGDERVSLFQQANAYQSEEIVPDVMLFHMPRFMRISERINFEPAGLVKIMELSRITFND